MAEKTAYITLDDGPNRYTADILRLLHDYKAQVTFFVLEPNIRSYPDLLKKADKEGHAIGAHGGSHDYNRVYSSEEIFLGEMDRCNETLEKVIGKRSRFIRPPYGSYPRMHKVFRNQVQNAGYIVWDWNVDSKDSLKKDVSVLEVVETIKAQVNSLEKQGVNPVILLHEKAVTVGVLAEIIPFLRQKGYNIKPISEGTKPACLWDFIEANFDLYTVNEGDTMSELGKLFGISTDELKRINGLKTEDIYTGQLLYAKPKNAKLNITPSKLIVHGNTSKKHIAFTYDTGFEDTETSVILDILKKFNIKCTFFVTGYWVERFPELANRIVREGHEIGNHSYKHPDMRKISYEAMLKTIADGEDAIKRITGVNPRPLFRHPYGEWNDEVLKTVGEGGYEYSIYWSIDTIDWQLPPKELIVERILKKAKNGDIVLMHVAGNNTAAATEIAIQELKNRGFEFVKISEILL